MFFLLGGCLEFNGGKAVSELEKEVFVSQTAEQTGLVSRFEGNPVLVKGEDGWEKRLVFNPRILKNADGTAFIDEQKRYWMYYLGGNYDGTAISLDQTGLAFSLDLIEWQKYSGNPVLPVSENFGDYDFADVQTGTVIKDGNVWRLWYSSNRRLHTEGLGDFVTVSYAVSSDGMNWEKFSGNPVLVQGEGDDDSQDLYSPAVIKDGNIWKMWYTGHNSWGDLKLMYAIASNPEGPWTKQNNGKYVFDPGFRMFSSEVWKQDNTFFLLYVNYDFYPYRIRLAKSSDGIYWKDFGVLFYEGNQGEWDNLSVYDPSQVYVNGEWRIFYTGVTSGEWAIGTAVPYPDFSLEVECSSGQLVGDADKDGKITFRDADLIRRMIAGLIDFPENLCCLDVSNDNRVSIVDVVKILRIEAGLEESTRTCPASCNGILSGYCSGSRHCINGTFYDNCFICSCPEGSSCVKINGQPECTSVVSGSLIPVSALD